MSNQGTVAINESEKELRMKRIGQSIKTFFLAVGTAALVTAAPLGVYGAEKGPGAAMKPAVNGVSIYVSKKGSTLTLSQDGRVIGKWSAKLGRESATGDKKQQGDEITPSGKFYVCTKNDKSQYYLALGLSYPGIEDAQRGLEDGLITQEQYQAIVDANEAGVQPPWDTALGGAIEIHGEQGGETAGCIAMTNEVMDVLWEYCNVGVPVTIGP